MNDSLRKGVRGEEREAAWPRAGGTGWWTWWTLASCPGGASRPSAASVRSDCSADVCSLRLASGKTKGSVEWVQADIKAGSPFPLCGAPQAFRVGLASVTVMGGVSPGLVGEAGPVPPGRDMVQDVAGSWAGGGDQRVSWRVQQPSFLPGVGVTIPGLDGRSNWARGWPDPGREASLHGWGCRSGHRIGVHG